MLPHHQLLQSHPTWVSHNLMAWWQYLDAHSPNAYAASDAHHSRNTPQLQPTFQQACRPDALVKQHLAHTRVHCRQRVIQQVDGSIRVGCTCQGHTSLLPA